MYFQVPCIPVYRHFFRCSVRFVQLFQMSDEVSIKIYPSLRVDQLDSTILDDEISRMFLEKLYKVRDSLPNYLSGFLSQFDPEFETALRTLLWYFTIRENGKLH